MYYLYFLFQTCGLEILLCRAQHLQCPGVSLTEDNPQWTNFLDNLNKRDYFLGEMEGSQKQCARMASAKEFFRNHFQGGHDEEKEGDGEEMRLVSGDV